MLTVVTVCMNGNTARDYSEELNKARNNQQGAFSRGTNRTFEPTTQRGAFSRGINRTFEPAKQKGAFSRGIGSTFEPEIQRGAFKRGGEMASLGLGNTIKNKAAAAEEYLPNELREKLDKARQDYKEAKQLGGEAKTLVKSLTPWGFFSLIGKIHPLTDAPYFFAIMAAILKDGLDLIGLGSLPVIGTVISSGSSIFTAAMMFLGNVMHAEHDRTVFQSILLKQFGVLLLTTVVEFLFGLNLAPFQTVGVVFIYAFALAARKGRNAIETEN